MSAIVEGMVTAILITIVSVPIFVVLHLIAERAYVAWQARRRGQGEG